MNSIAPQCSTPEMTIVKAEVKGRSEKHYMVLLDHGPVKAGRAAGCLLEPEVGDQVLAAWSESEGTYILTVLERGSRQMPSRISTPGDELVLQADRVKIDGIESLDLSGARLELETSQGQARFGTFSVHGHWLQTSLVRLSTAARYIDTMAERVTERLGRSYRRIAEFEETKAGRLRTIVEGLLFMGSKNTSIESKKRVKIDADKIQLG